MPRSALSLRNLSAVGRRSVCAYSMLCDRSRRTLVIQPQRRPHFLSHRLPQLLRL